MNALKAREGGCEEASMASSLTYIPCNKPATRMISWPARGEGPYRMCDMCADHSVKNRGATDLGPYTGPKAVALSDPNPRAQIGGNNPPIPERLAVDHKDLIEKMDKLTTVLPLFPAVLPPGPEGDVIAGDASDTLKQIKQNIKTAVAMDKMEQEPLKSDIKVIHNFFTIRIEKLEPVAAELQARLEKRAEEKVALERKAREERAEQERLEAARKLQEAEAAERREREAREAREAEERKEREAKERKEQALREAREAEERAEAARLEGIRLAKEAKERKEREEREAEERAKKKELDEAAEVIAKEKREKEQREHEEQMAVLKKKREDEEAEAKRLREKAAKERQDQNEAAERAAAAKKDEKVAGKDFNQAYEGAERSEKRADKLDRAAEAGDAELSRGRGELGSVASLASRWTYEVDDYTMLDIRALWPHINRDAVDAAIFKWMQLQPATPEARQMKGVRFFIDKSIRVA